MDHDDDETLRRIRAARAYAGLSQPAMATALGMGEATYKRLETGKRPIGDLERSSLLDRVAEETGVPREFLQHGFLPAALKQASEMFDQAEVALELAGSHIQRRRADLAQRVDELNGEEAALLDLQRRVLDLGATDDPDPEVVAALKREEAALREEAQRSRERREAAPDTSGASRNRPGAGA